MFIDTNPFPEFTAGKDTVFTPQDLDDVILDMVDFTPHCEVEIGLKSGSILSFSHWFTAKEFLRHWNKSKKKELCFVCEKGKFISINKKEVEYKIIEDILS